MKINYRIVEIHPLDHLVVVRYWTDSLSEDDLAVSPERGMDGKLVRCRSDVSISLPIPEPSKEELHKIFLSHAPVRGLEIAEAVKNPKVDTSMTNSLSLSTEVVSVELSDIPNIIAGVPTDAEIEAAILAAGSK